LAIADFDNCVHRLGELAAELRLPLLELRLRHAKMMAFEAMQRAEADAAASSSSSPSHSGAAATTSLVVLDGGSGTPTKGVS
jgi:hypothetical protein